MTTAKDLENDLLIWITEKREEITMEVDELTLPFIKTIAEPESKSDEAYAQKELDEILFHKAECEDLLNQLEDLLNEQ